MSLTIRCTRATDGSELFLLAFRSGGKTLSAHVLTREATEDLVYEVTGAVRSYDDVQANKPTPPRTRPPDAIA